ncbi:dentin sialophosphoprotein-like [Sitophilus oryzae]|uniref:Dentin sialophosphoprotein-like n=1 Tax=Sitophilus oryzae TaxID=7048 RepID=A0A6J2YCJ7_SITOR|nr:dentin sialophosphoprotein-like [Sitophilus oryzae]XP_030761047.1 dentin sialophosphoprotein-like [Sitophilus oryzae]
MSDLCYVEAVENLSHVDNISQDSDSDEVVFKHKNENNPEKMSNSTEDTNVNSTFNQTENSETGLALNGTFDNKNKLDTTFECAESKTDPKDLNQTSENQKDLNKIGETLGASEIHEEGHLPNSVSKTTFEDQAVKSEDSSKICDVKEDPGPEQLEKQDKNKSFDVNCEENTNKQETNSSISLTNKTLDNFEENKDLENVAGSKNVTPNTAENKDLNITETEEMHVLNVQSSLTSEDQRVNNNIGIDVKEDLSEEIPKEDQNKSFDVAESQARESSEQNMNSSGLNITKDIEENEDLEAVKDLLNKLSLADTPNCEEKLKTKVVEVVTEDAETKNNVESKDLNKTFDDTKGNIEELGKDITNTKDIEENEEDLEAVKDLDKLSLSDTPNCEENLKTKVGEVVTEDTETKNNVESKDLNKTFDDTKGNQDEQGKDVTNKFFSAAETLVISEKDFASKDSENKDLNQTFETLTQPENSEEKLENKVVEVSSTEDNDTKNNDENENSNETFGAKEELVKEDENKSAGSEINSSNQERVSSPVYKTLIGSGKDTSNSEENLEAKVFEAVSSEDKETNTNVGNKNLDKTIDIKEDSPEELRIRDKNKVFDAATSEMDSIKQEKISSDSSLNKTRVENETDASNVPEIQDMNKTFESSVTSNCREEIEFKGNNVESCTNIEDQKIKNNIKKSVLDETFGAKEDSSEKLVKQDINKPSLVDDTESKDLNKTLETSKELNQNNTVKNPTPANENLQSSVPENLDSTFEHNSTKNLDMSEEQELKCDKELEVMANSLNQTIDIEESAIVQEVNSSTSPDHSDVSDSLNKTMEGNKETQQNNKVKETVENDTQSTSEIKLAQSNEKIDEINVDKSKNNKISCRPNIRPLRTQTQIISKEVLKEINKNNKEPNKSDENPKEDYQNETDALKKYVSQLEKEVATLQENNLKKEVQKIEYSDHKTTEQIRRYMSTLQYYEQVIQAQNKDLEKVRAEYEQCSRLFSNTEMAFSDLYEKYQKARFVVENYKKNEESLLTSLQTSEAQLSKIQEKCTVLQSRYEDIVKMSDEKIAEEQQKHNAELVKLQAIAKRLEIKTSSLETALKQKTEECQALSALCDDITGTS